MNGLWSQICNDARPKNEATITRWEEQVENTEACPIAASGWARLFLHKIQ